MKLEVWMIRYVRNFWFNNSIMNLSFIINILKNFEFCYFPSVITNLIPFLFILTMLIQKVLRWVGIHAFNSLWSCGILKIQHNIFFIVCKKKILLILGVMSFCWNHKYLQCCKSRSTYTLLCFFFCYVSFGFEF